MLAIQEVEVCEHCVGHRQQANYWKAQHTRAVQRETELRAEVRRLVEINRHLITENKDLTGQNEALKYSLILLQKQVFGKTTEKTERKDDQEKEEQKEKEQQTQEDKQASGKEEGDKRGRGQQPGAKGHGRATHPELATEEVLHDFPESEKCCPNCRKPLFIFPDDTEDSEEVVWEVRVFKRVHKRKKGKPTCDCKALPGIVTAPGPAKLIPKGKFSVEFWVQVLLEKFLYQRPLYRQLKRLELEDFHGAQGTITGGLKRIEEMVLPLYAGILERARQAVFRQMDETSWRVYEQLAGKKGYKWWLWVMTTEDTVVFLIDPYRSAEAAKKLLGEDPEGFLVADRYSVYKTFLRIYLAFCWAHVRRDFIRVRDGYKRLRAWGEAWVVRINHIFSQNAIRLAVQGDPEAYNRENQRLRDSMAAMARTFRLELGDPSTHKACQKVLRSMKNHWNGLRIFVDHPEVPMDNNESERRLRNGVVGRKNYYGSGSIWSSMLTASLFTIFQTMLKNDIDPQKFLTAYLRACAENRGKAPASIASFLPWNISEEQKVVWAYPKKSA